MCMYNTVISTCVSSSHNKCNLEENRKNLLSFYGNFPLKEKTSKENNFGFKILTSFIQNMFF